MESTSNISPISSVAQLVAREHVVPRVYEIDDGKHKVVNTHFETLLYNRNGYLQTITNINTISYIVQGDANMNLFFYWALKAIAGSLLGSVTLEWFRKTKLGIWFFNKVSNMYDWAADRYNLKVLDI